jgi:murein DD-endopeptidase MepM/ murein hydrolase activator NlpD
MKPSVDNLKKIISAAIELWERIFLTQNTTINRSDSAQSVLRPILAENKNVPTEKIISDISTSNPVLSVPLPGFLICPIQGNDQNGNALTSKTVKVCSVVDHSGTAIDPDSKNHWGKGAKDQKVKAFNGEVGDGKPSAGAPYGYQRKIPAAFFSSGEINYVGDASDGSSAKYFLNYDGHAGYDFPYPKLTPVLATAKGRLHRAAIGDDPTYAASWDTDHSFFIQHENGYTSWYRHCEKLSEEIESLLSLERGCAVEKGQIIAFIGNKGTTPIHLHFEVLNDKQVIVDPYKDCLWEN